MSDDRPAAPTDGDVTGEEAPAGTRARRGRRELLTWVLACVAGAVAALVASGREWAAVTVGETLTGAHSGGAVPVTGASVAPVLTPLALAAAASALAVLATRGVWRRVVGGVLALCGAGVVAAALAGTSAGAALDAAADGNSLAVATSMTAKLSWTWPAVAVAGGAVLALAGVAACVRGGSWGGMSDRYDRPGSRTGPAASPRAPSDRAMWDAIDGGADPTADLPDQSKER